MEKSKVLNKTGEAFDDSMIMKTLATDDLGPIETIRIHLHNENTDEGVFIGIPRVPVVCHEKRDKPRWLAVSSMVMVWPFACDTDWTPAAVGHVREPMLGPRCS